MERSGFNEIQDVLLMNQAERDMLTFLNAKDVITPLPIGPKIRLRALKIFANFCQAEGSPIVDWTVITKKDFDDFKCS